MLLIVCDCIFLSLLQVEAAWAAAQQVMITGAMGSNAAAANGRFKQVEREVFEKVGDPETWLFVATDGGWWVGDTEDKNAREAWGYAHSVCAAGEMPPSAGPAQWQLHDGEDEWVEQTLQVEVLSAAQVRQ